VPEGWWRKPPPAWWREPPEERPGGPPWWLEAGEKRPAPAWSGACSEGGGSAPRTATLHGATPAERSQTNFNKEMIMSRKLASRVFGATLVSAAALGVLGFATPAFAVSDPPTSNYEFLLWVDANTSGDAWGYADSVQDFSYQTSEGNGGFPSQYNDKASSWSFCNGTSATLYVTIQLWTDTQQSGTEVDPITDTPVPADTCIIGNHISPNDSISSYRVTTSPTP
jgi:hypothetical protein